MTNSKPPKSQYKKNIFKVHNNALNILFEKKYNMSTFFPDIKGLYEVSYFSISVINNGLIIPFSSSPSIECNLIKNNLLDKDIIYNMSNYQNNVCWWNYSHEDKYEDKIAYYKLIKQGHTFGFTIKKNLDNNIFLCSFSTSISQPKQELQLYYKENLSGLLNLSQVCINKTSPFYTSYLTRKEEEKGNIIRKKVLRNKPYLSLVINNT